MIFLYNKFKSECLNYYSNGIPKGGWLRMVVTIEICQLRRLNNQTTRNCNADAVTRFQLYT